MSENQFSGIEKKEISKKYHLRFGGFALVLFLLLFGIQLGLSQYYTPQFWGLFILITLLYWGTGTITLLFLGTPNFGYAIMVSKMVRMLFSAAGMLAYVMMGGEEVIKVALMMLFLYFAYLLFEIRALLPNLQRDSKSDQNKS